MLDTSSNILVINVARIGDTLLVTPALRAIKAACPGGRLGYVMHPGRAELLAAMPELDERIAMKASTARWRGRIGARRWDYALVYGRNRTLIRYARRVAQRIVAFRQPDENLNSLIDHAVPPPSEPVHAVHERLLLPAALGIVAQDLRLRYHPHPSELRTAGALMSRELGPHCAPLVGLQVASFPTKAYRDWPLPSFIELGKRILEVYPRAGLLVLGGRESRERAAHLVDALGQRALSLAGRLDLRASAAIMAHLDLYVGVDTGPTHLAGALGIPMVALYHCYHRGRYLAPLQHPCLCVIEHPRGDPDCRRDAPMQEITVDAVWQGVCHVLGGQA